MAQHSARRGPRRHRGPRRRRADVSPARPLLCARDARLPARAALCLRVARLSGSDDPDAPRGAARVHAVRRRPRLRLHRARGNARRDAAHAQDRAIAVRLVAARDQAGRGRGRSGRHLDARVEAQSDRAVRRDGRRDRRLLRGRAARRHAAVRVRHARLGASADRGNVRRRGHGVGPRDRRRHARAALRLPRCASGRAARGTLRVREALLRGLRAERGGFRHSRRDLRHRNHYGDHARAGWRLLEGARSPAPAAREPRQRAPRPAPQRLACPRAQPKMQPFLRS